ncbi:Uncharacterised protein [Mycobacteroides abscessus subsp. abscessus]|nr:Uncharacterised protein [Mycobacteroides abscessus subsp. abscessus]
MMIQVLAPSAPVMSHLRPLTVMAKTERWCPLITGMR